MEKINSFLSKNKLEFYENFDISLISSMRLGEKLKIVIFPKTQKQLELILKFLWKNKIYFKVVGNLSNVLFVEKISYPVIITSKMEDEIEIRGEVVSVSAGMLISRFCDYLKKNCLSGFEGIAGIPATIGGGVMSNAGAFGYSISDKLISVKVFANGRVLELKKNQIKFGYHYSNLNGFIIISATFLFEKKKEYDIINLCNEYSYKRSISQPSGLTLGSVYKKVGEQSAGFYIERAGLKNSRIGGIVISNKHANFFVNDKSGSVLDFLRLSAWAQNVVEKQFGVSLVLEIEKVGDKNETFGRFAHSFEI